LTAGGLAVAAFDLYGHGQTAGKRGHAPSLEALHASIGAFLETMRTRLPEVPVFLYGHSMGGCLAASYVLHQQPAVQGVILSSPWLRLAFKPSSVDLFLAKTMVNIYPAFTQSTKLDASGISRDPVEVQRYQEDPLIHDMISPALFMAVHREGEWLMEQAGSWSYPLLLVHGTGDRITDWRASEAFAQSAGGDVTWKPWEGGFHELHHDPIRETLFDTYLGWIDQRLG
ncbi:MAG: alpha/beta fold hydrolase, partial [Bacteroidetes bacterium]